MFAEPHMNDFLDNIRWHLQRAADRGRTAVEELLAKPGTLGSPRAALMIFDAVRKEYDAGIETALGELKRCARIAKLDRRELRQATVQCLENFRLEMKSITQSDKYRSFGNPTVEKLDDFDQHLKFIVRQFDVGFLNPAEPEVPNVSDNSINIGSMHGSAIQQGSPHATQISHFNLNKDQARVALGALETALASLKLSGEIRDDISAELTTIRAQLSKSSPSHAILQQAGQSLRNVIEGITASLMTPAVIATAPALWSALNLG
jgi:hypothetical protein